MSTCITEQRNEPDMQGFQAFYEDNLVSIYRFVFHRVRNREEAEDLTSQIFLKVLRYLDPEQSLQSARSWLFKIAQTTMADYWRTHYRAPTSSLDVRLEAGWEGPPEAGILGTHERAAERVYNLLEALPERYREVLSCRFLLNLSLRETAATMGVSEANVKILQFRAIKHASNLANYRGEIPMDSKVYLDEKVRQAHYQDLLREAEKRRLLAQLPRHRRSVSRYAAGKLGLLLLKLGAWLKQFEQLPTVNEDRV